MGCKYKNCNITNIYWVDFCPVIYRYLPISKYTYRVLKLILINTDTTTRVVTLNSFFQDFLLIYLNIKR